MELLVPFDFRWVHCTLFWVLKVSYSIIAYQLLELWAQFQHIPTSNQVAKKQQPKNPGIWRDWDQTTRWAASQGQPTFGIVCYASRFDARHLAPFRRPPMSTHVNPWLEAFISSSSTGPSKTSTTWHQKDVWKNVTNCHSLPPKKKTKSCAQHNMYAQ